MMNELTGNKLQAYQEEIEFELHRFSGVDYSRISDYDKVRIGILTDVKWNLNKIMEKAPNEK